MSTVTRPCFGVTPPVKARMAFSISCGVARADGASAKRGKPRASGDHLASRRAARMDFSLVHLVSFVRRFVA